MPADSPTEFVITSNVRTAIVQALDGRPTVTTELLADLDASESAVYDALASLRERGIARETDNGWALTARGRIVADSVAVCQTTESFLATAPEYWETHRIDVIPDPFRRRLPELGDYEVYRDIPAEPNRSEQVAVSRMAAATAPDITTPFYSKNHQENVPDYPETRMLVTREATDISLQRYREGHREQLDDMPNVSVRLTECRFASVVGKDFLQFGLPTVESDEPTLSDTSATLVSETESAVQWGQELFEYLWERSEPLDSYIAEHHSDVL
jgi:predicted transcriptional regulator